MSTNKKTLIDGDFQVGSNHFIVDTDNNYVGFNNATPQNKIDVQVGPRTGTHSTDRPLYVTGVTTTSGAEFVSDDGTTGIGIGSSNIFTKGTNQNLTIAPNGTGAVGINTATPNPLGETFRVWIDGDAKATGNVTASYIYGDGSGLSNVAGTQWVSSSEDIYFLNNTGSGEGKVGIGKTSPEYKLDILDSDKPTIRVKSSSTGDGDALLILDSSATGESDIDFMHDGALNWRIRTGDEAASGTTFQINNSNDSDVLTIQQNGNVGVGTSSPGVPFEVSKSAGGDLIRLTNGTSTLYAGVDADPPWFGTSTDDHLRLFTNGTEKVRIESDGSVGVGTTAPDANLHVEGNTYVSSNFEVGQDKFFVDTTNSRVGVGTAAPDANLHVVGNTYVSSNFEVGQDKFFVDTTTTRVGVGTTAPDANLHVEGNTYVSSNFEVGQDKFFVDTTTTRVGVGTSTPGYTLDVVGDINMSSGSKLKVGGVDAIFSNWTKTGNDITYTAGNVGIGTTIPQEKFHLYGSPMIQHDTTYQQTTGSSGWYKLGVWEGSDSTGQGANLKLTLLGGSGYNSPDNNKGGETVIYAKLLNNTDTSVANIGGMFHSRGNPVVYQVKFVQVGSNRNKYEIRAEVPSYTKHNVSIECSITSTFTRDFSVSSDPGAESTTVRHAIFTDVVKENGNVGIKTLSPNYTLDVNGDANVSSNLMIGGQPVQAQRRWDIDLTAQSSSNFYPIALVSGQVTDGGDYAPINFKVVGKSFTNQDPFNESTLIGYARGGGWSDHAGFCKVHYARFSNNERRYQGIYEGSQYASNVIVIYMRGDYTYSLYTDADDVIVNTSAYTIQDSTFPIKNQSGTDVSGTSTNIIQLQNIADSSSTEQTQTTGNFVVNGYTGIGNNNPSSRLSVNREPDHDGGFNFGDIPLQVNYNTNVTSNSTLNDPKTVMLLTREGTSGQAYAAGAGFRLSRWENNGVNSRSRLDIALKDGSFDLTNVMTLLTNGDVDISGVLTQTGASWAYTNTGIREDYSYEGAFRGYAYLNRTLSSPVNVTKTDHPQVSPSIIRRSRITVNKAGKYAVYLNAFRQTGNSGTVEMFIHKNGSYINVRAYNGPNNTYNYSTVGSVYSIINMNANDFLEVYLSQGKIHGNDSIYFAGHLIA